MAPGAIGSSDLSEEAERGGIIQLPGITLQMLAEQLATKCADNFEVPKRRVQFGVAEERMGVQVARADRRPSVIDQHDLAVDVDRATAALGIPAGNSGEREAFMPTELRELCETLLMVRLPPGSADVILRVSRH